jgi:lysophospholipase L1-like esterase
MTKLWTFGDSFTQGYIRASLWADQYINWKSYTPKIFSEIISSELGIELVNKGVGGYDNNSIFESICVNVKNIKKNDIILIGWSDVVRFRLTTKTNDWQCFTVEPKYNLNRMENIAENTLNEIFVNRENPLYIKEIENWMNIIDMAFKDNIVLYWSSFIRDIKKCHHIDECENIYQETDGEINDFHLSENGQKKLADFFIKKLELLQIKKIH